MKSTIIALLGVGLLVGACKKEKPEPTLDGEWQMKESVRTDQQSGYSQTLAPTVTYNFRLVAKGDTVRSYLVNSTAPPLVLERNGYELRYTRGVGVCCTIKELTAHRLVLRSTAPYQATGMVGMLYIDDVYTR